MTIVSATFEQPWSALTETCSTGNVFTPGPFDGDATDPVGSLDPIYIIPAASTYNLVHTLSVVDLTDSAELQFASCSIATDENSICWTLNATGGEDLFTRFASATAKQISVTINGQEWRFVIEGVRRNRSFPSAPVSITGRSLAMLAGDPYSYEQNWVNNGPITAAQIVDQAQDFTLTTAVWNLEDWLVPERVWFFSGTPLNVAQRVASAVNALVISDRAEQQFTISPRYPVLPNEWSVTQPDVEIHADAIMVDSYERADKPAYNVIMVSGQQQGAVGRVFLAGTPADKMAPLITELLLTDTPALTQRAMAELGKGGPGARVTMTLPFIVADQGPGALDLNWLCHMVDDGADEWWGLVRGVTINVQMPSVTQQVVFERHTGTIEGTVSETFAEDTFSTDGDLDTLASEIGPPWVDGSDGETLPTWLEATGGSLRNKFASSNDYIAKIVVPGFENFYVEAVARMTQVGLNTISLSVFALNNMDDYEGAEAGIRLRDIGDGDLFYSNFYANDGAADEYHSEAAPGDPDLGLTQGTSFTLRLEVSAVRTVYKLKVNGTLVDTITLGASAPVPGMVGMSLGTGDTLGNLTVQSFKAGKL